MRDIRWSVVRGSCAQLSLFVFLIFGLVMVPAAAPDWGFSSFLYAILSLTVIRMLPIFLSLVGSGESTANRLFLGWFGPRGLASIVFVIIAMDAVLPAEHPIAMTVVCTVGFSLLLHGISANPIATWIAQRQPAAGRNDGTVPGK